MTLRIKPTLLASNLSKNIFEEYILEAKKHIDFALLELVDELSDLSLRPQLEYAILSGGKRLRPLLIVLSAESVGAKRDRIIRLALAFELMHTASLVHDDVIDQDEIRRGRLALHKKWSASDAILTGDALIALAVKLASDYGEAVLKTMVHSALELCDGAHKDIAFSLKKVTEKSYFRKIREKSASLFRASAFCGASVGGGTSLEVDSLSRFAENVGIAYQLRDDIIDFLQKETNVSRDLKSGIVNLPLIHTYFVSNSNERKELEKNREEIMNGNSQESSRNVENIVRLVLEKGSIQYCERRIDEYLSRAINSLSILKNTKYKTCLIQMAKMLKTIN